MITLRTALYTEALRTIALHVEALYAILYIITSIWRVFFFAKRAKDSMCLCIRQL